MKVFIVYSKNKELGGGIYCQRSKNSLSRQRQWKLIVYPGKQGTLIKFRVLFSSYPEQKDSCKFVVIPETCDLIFDQQIEEET